MSTISGDSDEASFGGRASEYNGDYASLSLVPCTLFCAVDVLTADGLPKKMTFIETRVNGATFYHACRCYGLCVEPLYRYN